MFQRLRSIVSGQRRMVGWRRFAALFLGTFVGAIALIYALVLLIDPYGIFPFSLPIKRPLISINQRLMYPQVVRSGQFDSFVVGTSTSRLLDPQLLDRLFGARFANLGMDAARAWEQTQLARLFLRHAETPKVMLLGLDLPWCEQDADTHRITPRGFPDWLYQDNPWMTLPYLLNSQTVENAGRLIGYQLSLYRERSRFDGYEEFVPPEPSYDAAKASQMIWNGPPRPLTAAPPPPFQLSEARRLSLRFPALQWLDEILKSAPPTTLKILAFMPVHIAAQPVPGSEAEAVEAECKARIVQIARTRGATVIDWRIASPLTSNDLNYWDSVHYRIPVAQRLAAELGAAVLQNRPSPDGSYRLLTRPN